MRAITLACLLTTGCLSHMPPASLEHLQIHWAADYDAAAREAAAHHKPMLVCLIAGKIDGLCGYGGDVLRSAALKDARVIDLINDQFVPVWINVRQTPVPPFPFLDQILVNGRVDQNNRITDPFSEGFFVRSVIVSPDGQTLLNPQSPTVRASMAKLMMSGDLGYAMVDPGDYLVMLTHALTRFHASR